MTAPPGYRVTPRLGRTPFGGAGTTDLLLYFRLANYRRSRVMNQELKHLRRIAARYNKRASMRLWLRIRDAAG